MAQPDRRAYLAGWARVRRKENCAALQAIKLERGCVDCGYDAHPAALDFDHRDPATKCFDISRALSTRSLSTLLEEVAKCDVRCANCHRVRSWQNRWGNHVPRPQPPKLPRPPKPAKPPRRGHARGARNGSAKLDDAAVMEIRRLGQAIAPGGSGRRPAGQLTWAAVGRQFGITAAQARNVALGLSWTHL